MKNKYLSIFYNKKTLQDTLIAKIGGSSEFTIKKIINPDVIAFYDNNNELVGFNIQNASEKDLNLNEGLNEPTNELIEKLQLITNLNLVEFVDKIPFVVGLVKKVTPIPNTHLNMCEIDIGNETLQKIVCGASNVRKDLKVVVILPGGILPSGKEIIESKVMNYESNGMICSSTELNLPVKNNISRTILELPEDTINYQPFKNIYNSKK